MANEEKRRSEGAGADKCMRLRLVRQTIKNLGPEKARGIGAS